MRVDAHYADGVCEADVDQWVPTASLLHSNGDAMDIAVKDGLIVGVRGIATDRVNHGRLDVKDLYAWQASQSADRLRVPLIRRDGELVETDWDTAMAAIVLHLASDCHPQTQRQIRWANTTIKTLSPHASSSPTTTSTLCC